MIIQTSNQPIEIEFSENMESIPKIRITLWNGSTKLKEWTEETVTVSGKNVTCPLTQSETKLFPIGFSKLEIKWLDLDGKTEFCNRVDILVDERKDSTLLEEEND